MAEINTEQLLRACGLHSLGTDPPPEAVEETVGKVGKLRSSGTLTDDELGKFGERVKQAWSDAGLDVEELWERTTPAESTPTPQEMNQKQRLVQIAEEDATFFSDERDRAYALIRVEGHREVWPLRSRRFKAYLAQEFYRRKKNAPSGSLLSDALNVLLGKAYFEGEKLELANRFCRHDGALYYDLADEEWRAVRITDAGWSIDREPPPLFRRYSHQRPQVVPERGGDLRELLRPFVNVSSKDDYLLILVWLVASLLPDVARPILILWGPQGSAKTTAAKFFRRVIDPSAVPMPRTPRDDKELAQTLDHHAAPFFDNLSFIDNRTSDTLCRAVTGDGFSKRQLYTDDDDVLYQYQRVILLNGINVPASRPDLLDRSVLVRLSRIPKKDRLEERELFAKFEEDWPKIFGALLTALSRAMGTVTRVRLPELPRMADWTRWGAAIAEALGFDRGEFLEAYANNRRAHHAEALTSHPVGAAVQAFMRERKSWEGAPKELLLKLEAVAGQERIDTGARLWPGSASWLTRRLREVETNLEAEGIAFEEGTRSSDSRSLRLWKADAEVADTGDVQGSLDIRGKAPREGVTDVTRVTAASRRGSSGVDQPDGALTPVGGPASLEPSESDDDSVPSGQASTSESAVHGNSVDGDASDDALSTSSAGSPNRVRPNPDERPSDQPDRGERDEPEPGT